MRTCVLKQTAYKYKMINVKNNTSHKKTAAQRRQYISSNHSNYSSVSDESAIAITNSNVSRDIAIIILKYLLAYILLQVNAVSLIGSLMAEWLEQTCLSDMKCTS